MFDTISSKVEGLKTVYAYDPEGIIKESPSAYFEFDSIEAAKAALKTIKHFAMLGLLIDKRIPDDTKSEVVLGYSVKNCAAFGAPRKADELIHRAVNVMSRSQEIKEVPVVKVKFRQLKLPWGRFEGLGN